MQNNNDTALMKSVHHFWFGSLQTEMPPREITDKWFNYSPETDGEIADKYAHALESAAAGKFPQWRHSAQGCLVLILLFDQFPRNMFRGEERAFAYAAHAEEVAGYVLEKSYDARMHTAERVFCYLPFMHSENISLQERSVVLFKKLLASAGADQYEFVRSSLSMAREHRDIVGRFGRFPHRNAVLGRESTEEEVIFLGEESHKYEWMAGHSRR